MGDGMTEHITHHRCAHTQLSIYNLKWLLIPV